MEDAIGYTDDRTLASCAEATPSQHPAQVVHEKMYKLLLVFASAQALKRPQRALAVRGGEIDPIQIGKGIVAASGLYAAFDPKGNLEKYGCKNIGKSGETLMRAGALGQLVFAAALNMDSEVVHGQISYHMLAFVLLSQPTWEFHQAPKMPDAIWMAIMGAVGYKTLDGSLSKWVITAICLANGAQFFLAPDSAVDMYEMKGVSKLGKAMMTGLGAQLLGVGTYLACLLKDKSQSEAFAYAMCVYAATGTKFALVDSNDLNVPKAGPLAWAALSLGLAYKALN